MLQNFFIKLFCLFKNRFFVFSLTASLHSDWGFDVWMTLIIGDGKILVLEVKDARNRRI